MKKLLAILMCASLIFCTSCGKKDVTEEPKETENKIEEAVKEIDKVMAEDPANIDASNIAEAKAQAAELEKSLQEKVGKVAEEDAEEFQNQQAAVAILQQGLDALEAAQKSGDEQAIEDAKNMIEMAKSLWDFQQEE